MFSIHARPALRAITPGSKVRYEVWIAAEHSDQKLLEKARYRWFCRINIDQWLSSTVAGPRDWYWNADWDFEGQHQIVCLITYGGKTYRCELNQAVVSIQSQLVGGPTLPLDKSDPENILDGYKRVLTAFEAANSKYPPLTSEAKDDYKKHHAAYIDKRDKLEQRLTSTKHTRRHPVQAEYFNAETQSRNSLRAFISKVGGKKWLLVDWTDPAIRSTTGEYSGYDSDPNAGAAKTFSSWNSGNRYPKGGIVYKMPPFVLSAGSHIGTKITEKNGQFETDGASALDTASNVLSVIGLGAAVIAGVATAIAPVPGSRVASAAIWTSIIASTGAAVMNIGTRVDEGFSSWRSNAFDILTIVGNVFGAGAASQIWKRGASLVVTQAASGSRFTKYALIGSVSVDGIQGVLLADSYATEYDQIQNNPTIPPHERVYKLINLLGRAVADTAMIYVSVKGTKVDIDNLHVSGHGHGHLSPHEKLEHLKDHTKTIDTTKTNIVEGHSSHDKHKTKVQIDEQTPSPHVGGHKKSNSPVEIKSDKGKVIGRFERGNHLDVISKTPLYGGSKIELDPRKTTTITGVLSDVNVIARRGEMHPGITKMGENVGGINILRSPKWGEIQVRHAPLKASNPKLFWKKVADDFWNEANKPWLDEAIKRGDKFRFVSDPKLDKNKFVRDKGKFVLDETGNKIHTIFFRELEHLKANGYKILENGTAVKM